MIRFAIRIKLLFNLQDSKHFTEIIFQDICLVKASSHKTSHLARRMKYWQVWSFAISKRVITYVHVIRCLPSFIRLKFTVSVLFNLVIVSVLIDLKDSCVVVESISNSEKSWRIFDSFAQRWIQFIMNR